LLWHLKIIGRCTIALNVEAKANRSMFARSDERWRPIDPGTRPAPRGETWRFLFS
jgi:hypothetical protein